jgi:hypothetical protein
MVDLLARGRFEDHGEDRLLPRRIAKSRDFI